MSTENFKDKSFKFKELSKCPFTGNGTPAKFSAVEVRQTEIFGQTV